MRALCEAARLEPGPQLVADALVILRFPQDRSASMARTLSILSAIVTRSGPGPGTTLNHLLRGAGGLIQTILQFLKMCKDFARIHIELAGLRQGDKALQRHNVHRNFHFPGNSHNGFVQLAGENVIADKIKVKR